MPASIIESMSYPPLHSVDISSIDDDPFDEKNLEDFVYEIRQCFEPSIGLSKLLSISLNFQDQFERKLQAPGIFMLPSWNHTLPTGLEHGRFLALDVGGSTFRVALVDLAGRNAGEKAARIVELRHYKIGVPVKALEGLAFFDWIADKIADVLTDDEIRRVFGSSTIPMGLAWSFPVLQTSSFNFTMLEMGKDFCANRGLIGEDLGNIFMRVCKQKNLNVRLGAIINDASATLLSRSYIDPCTRISLIVGTGTNAAIHLPVTAFANSKFGVRPQSWYDVARHVLVNTELSLFGKSFLPTTRWDEELNRSHTVPDFQPLEFRVGGRYLGEIVRLICVEAVQTAGLFGGMMPARFDEPYSFETALIASIECDRSPGMARSLAAFLSAHSMAIPPTRNDFHFIRAAADIVMRRAAALLAAAIHGLCVIRARKETIDGVITAFGPVTIACSGSIIEQYPGFRRRVQNFIDRLCDADETVENLGPIRLEQARDATLLGAAVAICCAAAEAEADPRETGS